MEQNINIEFIVTTLKILPAKYGSDKVHIAKGKWEMPTSFKKIFKKFVNG